MINILVCHKIYSRRISKWQSVHRQGSLPPHNPSILTFPFAMFLIHKVHSILFSSCQSQAQDTQSSPSMQFPSTPPAPTPSPLTPPSSSSPIFPKLERHSLSDSPSPPASTTHMSLSPSQEQLKAADNTVNDTQHSRMPSPTPQLAHSPIKTTQTPAQPAETPPHPSPQHPSASQPAPDPKAPRNPQQDPSPKQPAASSKASTTISFLSPSSNMAEAQTQPDGHGINDDNTYHQPPEPQHQQPDPVDSSKPLEDHDWDDLEARFEEKMAECDRAEQGIDGEFKELLKVCSFHLYLSEQKTHVNETYLTIFSNHNTNQPNKRSFSNSGHRPVPRTRKRGRVNGAYPTTLAYLSSKASSHPRQLLTARHTQLKNPNGIRAALRKDSGGEAEALCAPPSHPRHTSLPSPVPLQTPPTDNNVNTNAGCRYKSSPSFRECARSPCRLRTSITRLTSRSLATQTQWMSWLLTSC